VRYLLPATVRPELNWRTFLRSIRAKDTAVSLLWPNQRAARRTVMEVDASVSRHRLDRDMPASRARQLTCCFDARAHSAVIFPAGTLAIRPASRGMRSTLQEIGSLPLLDLCRSRRHIGTCVPICLSDIRPAEPSSCFETKDKNFAPPGSPTVRGGVRHGILQGTL
jgi:DNA-binding transcriptional regulator YdaS (Cro superfamily)